MVRWQRVWDSNPRKTKALDAFQERCIKPLCQPALMAERGGPDPHALSGTNGLANRGWPRQLHFPYSVSIVKEKAPILLGIGALGQAKQIAYRHPEGEDELLDDEMKCFIALFLPYYFIYDVQSGKLFIKIVRQRHTEILSIYITNKINQDLNTPINITHIHSLNRRMHIAQWE